MKAYRKLLDEINAVPAEASPERKNLLEPKALAHVGELGFFIKPQKHYVGPGTWYKAIEKLSPLH